MRPLILEYIENTNCIDFDDSLIEYCEEKSLSVVKGTDKTAILYSNLETETFSKSSGEPTDSDKDTMNSLNLLMETETGTFKHEEPTDSDKNHSTILQILETHTYTESIEPTDSDR